MMPSLSPEHAPSKPVATPLQLALEHQRAAHAFVKKADIEGACISQLLVGRDITAHGRFYKVTEIRMSLGKTAAVHGIEHGKSRRVHIGPLGDIKLWGKDLPL